MLSVDVVEDGALLVVAERNLAVDVVQRLELLRVRGCVTAAGVSSAHDRHLAATSGWKLRSLLHPGSGGGRGALAAVGGAVRALGHRLAPEAGQEVHGDGG